MSSATFEHVTKRYAGGDVALKDLCLHVHDGEFMVMAGRAHDDGQATMVDAYFKWLFNCKGFLTLFGCVFLPMGDTDVHDTLWIEG